MILAYHNVIPDDEPITGEASLHLALSDFEEQLDVLERYARIVPLSAVLEDPPDHSADAITLVVTFDDAYTAAVQLAMPRLAENGFAATIFVASNLLGEDEFWWDAVALTPNERDEICLGRLRGEWTRVMTWAEENRRLRGMPQGDHQRPATAQDLEVAARLGNVSFGPHTATHPNLEALSPSEPRQEVRASWEWLLESGLPTVKCLAYPYGILTPGIAGACAEVGIEDAVLVDGGFLQPARTERLRLPRVSIPANGTYENFLLRLSGVVGN